MIWLASFPRSGNTFFRNVLHEVYGIASSTYHRDPDRNLDANFKDFPVVKTHLLPKDLPASLRDLPSVYIIRDGRDSLVSIAHHRKDIVAPGSDFYNNLLEAILAQEGSFFGGWSENVQQWTDKADVVIRFEDLIANPIEEVEKLRSILDLPPPALEKLPSFKDLKFGRPAYGGGKGQNFKTERAQLHFRKGKIGAWQEELPPSLEKLLMAQHGPQLIEWGYAKPASAAPPKQKRVMIEANKLYSSDNDGIKRYLAELLNGLKVILPHLPEWQIALYDHKNIQPLIQREDATEGTDSEFRTLDEKEAILKDRRKMGYEKKLLLFKIFVKKNLPTALYEPISNYYRQGPFRRMLQSIQQRAMRWRYRKKKDDIKAALQSADLIHVPLPQHMPEVPETSANILVSVHDLTHRLFPEYHTQQNIQLAEKGMQDLIRRKAHILNVSQSTLQDVQAAYHLPTERLHLCYEAADKSQFKPSLRQTNIDRLRKKYGLPDGPYLMCLSTIEPRKNLRNTLKAFIELKIQQPTLDISLVVCGKKGWKTGEIFSELDLERTDLCFTGFVDDAHLPLLYANAKVLCYVSFYEGFGLPLLEAMSCGTPVIYGQNSSMPEIAGAAGLPADPEDVSQICHQMQQLLTDEQLWQDKSREAWRQANRFSWLKAALETLQIYDKVIESSRP